MSVICVFRSALAFYRMLGFCVSSLINVFYSIFITHAYFISTRFSSRVHVRVYIRETSLISRMCANWPHGFDATIFLSQLSILLKLLSCVQNSTQIVSYCDYILIRGSLIDDYVRFLSFCTCKKYIYFSLQFSLFALYAHARNERERTHQCILI